MGDCVGELLGLFVGLVLGDRVGLALGEIVGETAGEALGERVGDTVGVEVGTQSLTSSAKTTVAIAPDSFRYTNISSASKPDVNVATSLELSPPVAMLITSCSAPLKYSSALFGDTSKSMSTRNDTFRGVLPKSKRNTPPYWQSSGSPTSPSSLRINKFPSAWKLTFGLDEAPPAPTPGPPKSWCGVPKSTSPPVGADELKIITGYAPPHLFSTAVTLYSEFPTTVSPAENCSKSMSVSLFSL